MFKVLISDSISKVAQQIFEKNKVSVDIKTGLSEEEIIKIIPDYDSLVVRSATKVTKNIILAGKKLKVIGRAGAGVDNIDVPVAKENNIVRFGLMRKIKLLKLLIKQNFHTNL